MKLEKLNYKEGRPLFNKLLIKMVVPFYTYIKLKRLRVKIVGIDGGVPKTGRILIASHHEDDADPFVISKAVRRRLNWIAAPEIFGKSVLEYKFLKKLLDKLGIVSIHKKMPSKNKGLFDYIAYLIKIGEAVVIFPESNLRSERGNRRLGQARDGVIRLAMFAEKRIGKKVPIYPIGLEYKKKKNLKEAFIRIGNPLFINNKKTTKKSLERLIKEIARLSNIRYDSYINIIGR